MQHAIFAELVRLLLLSDQELLITRFAEFEKDIAPNSQQFPWSIARLPDSQLRVT
jgi:hypothetical protein